MSHRQPQYPIAVVTRKTGIGADVIRAWERRYGAIEPARTPGNRRLYTDDDVERLILLRRALDAGWQIGQVAALPDEELSELIGDVEAAAAPEPRRSPADDRLERHRRTCLEAIEALDGERLLRRLERASVELSRIELLDRVVVPLVRHVGAACADGSLRTVHEHLCSAVLRSFLDAMHGAFPASQSAPVMIVTTPASQHHELGALIVAAIARIEGWNTVYLGPNLPAEEIAAAAKQRRARAVALSVTFPGDDPQLPTELRRLARSLGENVTLLVGGSSAECYRRVLAEIRATLLDDLSDLRGFLRAARMPAARAES